MIFNPGIVPPSKGGGGAVEFVAGPVVTTEANAAMNFDLSQVDMTKVAALFLTFCVGATSGAVKLSLNGKEQGTVCNNFNYSTCAGIIWVVPFTKNAAFFPTLMSNGNVVSGMGSGTVAWTAINKLTLSGQSYAGATATLFALKRE